MSERKRNERNNPHVNIQQIVNQEIDAVRKAWRLTPPETDYRDPRWLRSASRQASKAGKLPKRHPCDSVMSQLHQAGYHKAIDHMTVVHVDGERHVILEPYESSCSMDTARRIAAEFANRLGCKAWVSLRSWHYPGSTIRITLAPLHTLASDATQDADVNEMPTDAENATAGHLCPHDASAKVALRHSGATICYGPYGRGKRL
ncbi:MAG: hypothetical protein SGI77_16165 [Pirellulaceae bacterium]|nr:hypothetical protein [Pirellulaceae bacterium]